MILYIFLRVDQITWRVTRKRKREGEGEREREAGRQRERQVVREEHITR